jgi:hypothetical protein
MANRIQLRRDTTANWNRVNPILEDGEPGLDITTNQIKYGDGSSTWTELAYAGGGGSVSFDYSTVQEGISTEGPSDTNVTSITGDTGTGVSLTSDEWAQLMWTPNTANVTINQIAGGGNVYNWAYVDDSGFHIENDTGPDSHEWQFTTTGNLTLPQGGKISESTYLSADSIRLKPNGGTSTQYLEIAPTAVDGNHIHLMAGSGTELFLGDDFHYVKLANTGGVVINSNDGSGNTAQWTFGTDGNLTIPGDIKSTTDASIVVGNASSITNIVIQALDYEAPFWRAFVNANTYPTLGQSIQVGDTFTTAWGTPVTATIQQILDDRVGSSQWVFYVDQDVLTGNTYGGTATFTQVPATWTFGNTGRLTLPTGGRIITDGSTGTTAHHWHNYPNSTNNWFIRLYEDEGANLKARLGLENLSDITIETTGNIAGLTGDGPNYKWTFGGDGTLTTPGNVTIGSGYGNISQIDTIFANNYAYANGVSILDGVGGSYGNTEVAQYLTNYDGDINFTSSVAIISNVDVITVLDSIRSPAYQFSNGVSILSGLGYGNTEVATYLASGNLQTAQIHGNLTVGNLTVNGNITYINTNSYVVTDNIVQFASDNPADTLDLGFVAHRTVGGTLQHTGLVRDASAGQWKLFSNVAAQPGSTVDFTGVVYDDLQLDKLYADTIHLTGTAPSTNLGAAGDLEGDIHVDDNYLYYCTQDWTASSWTVGWGGSTSNTLFLTQGDYPTPQVGWIVDQGGNGPWTIDTISDTGYGSWQITWVGSNFGSPTGGTASLTNPNPAVIWKTVPLNTFQTGAYGNTQVASYLTTYTGNIGNVKTTANVVTSGYFLGNGALLTGIVSGSGSNYSNVNVASYLGNVSTNIKPATRLTYTLGEHNKEWASAHIQDVYIKSTLQAGDGGIGYSGGNAGELLKSTGSGIAWQEIKTVNGNSLFGNGDITISGESTYGNANVIANLQTLTTDITTTANVTASNIITSGATSGNISGANYISANAFQVSTGIFWANGTAWSSGTTYSSTGAGNVTIVGSAINLTASGPGATSVGSSTAIPVVTTDAYGRVSTMTTAAVVAPAGTLSGSTLNATVTASSLTSVGTLVSLAVTGNVSAANVAVTNTVTAANIVTTGTYGNITGANVISANTVTVTTCVRTQPVTFSALPSASGVGAGARAYITDGNTSTFGSQVSGGGANSVPVYSNGTNWYVG